MANKRAKHDFVVAFSRKGETPVEVEMTLEEFTLLRDSLEYVTAKARSAKLDVSVAQFDLLGRAAAFVLKGGKLGKKTYNYTV